LNRVREAKTLLEQEAERGLVGCHYGWAYHAVSRACLLLGWVDEARRLGDCALESSRRQPGSTAHALRLLGDIATHPDRFDVESGAAHYRQALALADLHSMRPLVAHCHLGLGRLYRRIGETERARENFTAATAMPRDGNRPLARSERGNMTRSSDVAARAPRQNPRLHELFKSE
jgi:hypothetical protein